MTNVSFVKKKKDYCKNKEEKGKLVRNILLSYIVSTKMKFL